MRTRHTTRYPGIRFRLLDEARPDGPRRYVIGYTDANGAYHTETLGLGYTLEDAKARKAALEGKKNVYVPVKKTVGVLLDEYIEARRPTLKPKTVENYEWAAGRLKDAFGNRELTALTPNDIAQAIARWKATGMKTWTVRKILTPLVGALKVAMREGWITSNPADRLLPHERPKADQRDMRCLTPDEIEVLLDAVDGPGWRKPLFATLVFTGLRISEALALTWDDVNGSVRVVEGKTQAAERSVMLIPTLDMILKKHRLAQPPGTSLVFVTSTGNPVQRHGALKALKVAEKKAGLPDYTLHELRHTFASILIANGESVALVADQMGHANPAITLSTYAKLFDAQKNVEAARDRLQAAVGGVV